MIRICDGTTGDRPCPRRNPCEGDCHFNTATETFTMQSYTDPANPPTFDISSDRAFCWAVWGMVTVIVFTLALPVVWLIGEFI